MKYFVKKIGSTVVLDGYGEFNLLKSLEINLQCEQTVNKSEMCNCDSASPSNMNTVYLKELWYSPS